MQESKYYVKHTTHPDDSQPNWIVYERREIGPRAACLCYDEPTALSIADLLNQSTSVQQRIVELERQISETHDQVESIQVLGLPVPLSREYSIEQRVNELVNLLILAGQHKSPDVS